MRVRMNERGVIFLAISVSLVVLSVSIRSPPLILVSSLALSYILGYPISVYNMPKPNVKIKVKLRNSVVFRGEVEIMKITITNNGSTFLPILRMLVKFPNSVFVVNQSNLRIFSLAPYEEINYTIPFLAARRGTFDIGEVELKLGDPFLFFEEIIAKSTALEFHVYPKRIGRRVSKQKSKEVFSALVGLFSTQYKGLGTDFHGLREYIRGDPVKIIDWKGTARSNKLISKEFEAEMKLEVIVAIAAGSTARGPKFDYMLGIGMDIFEGIVEQNFPVGLLIFDDQLIKNFSPSISKKKKMQILAETFSLQPSDSYADYHVLSRYIEKYSITGHLVIVIGDIEGDMDNVVDAMRDIRLRQNNVMFVDVWGYSFSFEQELIDATSDHGSDSYGLILSSVIGPDLEQSQFFRGSKMRNRLRSHGSLYSYIENQDDNIVRSIERALFSFFGSKWKF